MFDINRLERLKFWCQHVLPLVYDDSLSYYEFLCKVCEYINNIITNQNDMADEIKDMGMDISTLQNDVAYLQGELEKIKNGEYMDVYIEALQKWIDNNLYQLINRTVKYVFFGLTDDGHFCAYIPEKWNFLEFNTILDYSNPLYGHLVMRW